MWHFKMKKKLTYILIFILGFCQQSCKVTWDNDGNRIRLKEDSNCGEHERYEIKILFRTQYKKQFFQKYSGNITIKERTDLTSVQFDSLTVNVRKDASKYNPLFTSGLLSAQMLNVSIKDTNTICCFEELKYLKYPSTKKRFKFLVFERNMFNPCVYLLELTNENANEKTDLVTFINGSKLTFLFLKGIQI